LTVLWPCNIMEKIIDAVVHEIIVLNPEKRDLFRTKERWLSYPRSGFTASRGPRSKKNAPFSTLNETYQPP